LAGVVSPCVASAGVVASWADLPWATLGRRGAGLLCAALAAACVPAAGFAFEAWAACCLAFGWDDERADRVTEGLVTTAP
jgi:hypothetical protein